MKMQLNVKKSTVNAIPVNHIRATISGDGILIDCPKCKATHQFDGEWPIDKMLVCNAICGNGTCGCNFIIKNDTPIED